MTEQILLFIESHSQWAFVFVFLIAFTESLLIIGLFIPGWLLLVGIGALIGAQVLSFYPVVIAAYAGAVLGEYLSYYLGFHFHQQILAWPWVAKQQKLVSYARQFFKKYGVSGVFFGRFLGPTRAVVPFIAGVSEMPKSTFFWVNILSGLIWAPVYLIPGILVGAAFSLDNQQQQQLLTVLLLITIGVSIAVNYCKQYFRLERAKRTFFSVLKPSLSILIVLVLIVIFAASPLWDLFINILNLVFQRLQ